MFVSKKKLKALVDENMALRKENRRLMAENNRLSNSNFDLHWENKMLSLSMCRKQRQKYGEYFYG